jgi:hypothetical protein
MDGLNAAADAFSPCAPDGKENVDAQTAKVSRPFGAARTWWASKGGLGEGAARVLAAAEMAVQGLREACP